MAVLIRHAQRSQLELPAMVTFNCALIIHGNMAKPDQPLYPLLSSTDPKVTIVSHPSALPDPAA